jgi:outer membrane usher protein FimD/PapC
MDITPDEYDTPVDTAPPAPAPVTPKPNRPRPAVSPLDPAFQIPAGSVPSATAAEPVSKPRSQEELSRMSREELFRLAFGRAAPERPRSLMTRVFAEGRAFGSVEIVYSGDFSSFDFKSPPLTRFLDGILLPEARGKVGDSSGLFNSAALRGAGYEVILDETRFELFISIPPEDKAVQRTYLGGHYETALDGEELKPAHVSFYANYRLDYRHSYTSYDYDSSYTNVSRERNGFARDPAVFDFDAALSVSGWALEGSGYFREPYVWNMESVRENFERGDIRLVRDIVPWQSRLSAGDVGIYSDILGGGALGGVRWERNGWFFGNDPRDKENFVRFFMAKGGWVEVYLNGAYSRRIYLPAGHHELAGFGGDVGRNRALLVLRADDGSIEEIPFEYALDDPRGMQRGESRWSATAGLRRDPEPSPMRYRYIVEDPAAHADVFYGLLNWMSVGFAAQGSGENGAAGTQILMDMGDFGWVDLRAYVSGAGYERFGERADLSYTAKLRPMLARLNRLITGDLQREVLPRASLSARGYWQSSTYNASLFGSTNTNRTPALAGASGNLGLSMFNLNFTATGGVNFESDTADYRGYGVSGYTWGARLSYSINQAAFSVSAGENVSWQGKTRVRAPYFNANTNWALGFRIKNHRFSASTNTDMRRVSVAKSARPVWDTVDNIWRYDTIPAHGENRWGHGVSAGWQWSNNGSGAGAQSYSAGVGWRSDGYPVYSGIAQYDHNRASLTLNYGSYHYESYDYATDAHDVRALLSGSLMMADGLFALGRPVSNGFVLAGTRGNMRGANLHINRSHHFRQDLSRSGLLGAAYHNRLMEYRPTQLTLTLTDVPSGAFWEQNRYYALGAYKQGYALRVGDKKRNVIAQVRFTDAGKPLSYAYVTIEPYDDWAGGEGEGERRASFTGSDGVLQIGGLTPGQSYIIKFGAAAYLKDAVIDIPYDAKGIAELPDVSVERE